MKTVALGEIATFVRGVTFKPSEVIGDGVGVMRTKNVQEALDLTDVVRIPERLVKRSSQYLQQGDTLISSANSWNLVGKACWVGVLQEPLAVGGFVTALRPDTSQVEPRFLYRWFTSPRTQAELRSLSNKTTSISNLNLKLSAQMPVPLPSLDEQRRIARILDQADAICAKRRGVLAHFGALTQSVFHRMFGRATDPGWPTRLVGDIAEVRLGKMLDAKKQTGRESWPYLRNANVKWFHFDVTHLLSMDFNERDRKILTLRPGDVLVCEGGEPGRCAVWRGEVEECYFQKALHRVRLDESVDPDYFVRAVRSIVDEGGLKDFVTSSTISHLTGEKLRRLPVPVPPFELQREFAARVERVDAQRALVRRALDADNELFASLQARAFRGEL